MSAEPNILIIDSSPAVLAELERKVKGLNFKPWPMTSLDIPISQVEILNPEVVFLGPSLDCKTVLKFIHTIRIISHLTPILSSCEEIVSPGGITSVPFDGIYYVNPDPYEKAIFNVIQNAIEKKEEKSLTPTFQVLIGQGRQIKAIREKIRKVSTKDITVLITGETGTGKELIARAIHYHSGRSKGPLVKINCGALPDELLESEVFGFQRGAFTDAHKDKPGMLEMAHNGTLFIDEIGNLSLSLQVKFLQVLEDQTFTRLGGVEDKIIDTRVVAATNSNLQKKVREGSFRKDLFYRLNIVHIIAPPLRERKDDILLLAQYYMTRYSHELKKEAVEIPDNVANLFMEYHWPGNVRELENIIRLGIVLRDWSFAFKELSVAKDLDQGTNSLSLSSAYLPNLEWDDAKVRDYFNRDEFSLKKLSKDYVSEAERQAILDTLRETHWNRKKAAKILKVSYKTILNRIEEFDLKP